MATRIPASVRGPGRAAGADRAGGAAVRRRRLRRHGPVRARQGAVAAASSAPGGRHSEPRHLLADLPAAGPARLAPSADLGGRRGAPRLRGQLRPLRRGLRPAGRERCDRRRRRQDRPAQLRPPARASAAPTGERLGGRAAGGAGAAEGRRRQQPDRGPDCLAAGLGNQAAPTPFRGPSWHCSPSRGTSSPPTRCTVLERGGAYVLALKGNQPALYEDVCLWLDEPAALVDDTCQTVDGDHGRIETRRAMVAHDVAGLAERRDFPASPRLPRLVPRARSTARRRPQAATACSRPSSAVRQPRPGLHPRQDRAPRLGRRLPCPDPRRRLVRLPCIASPAQSKSPASMA